MPIIVGSLRSGTTLLRFMLDSHSELTIPPETGFLALAPKLRGRGDKLREKFLRAVINHPQPISGWPDFEISEGAFWTAPDGDQSLQRRRRVPGILSIVRGSLGETAMG